MSDGQRRVARASRVGADRTVPTPTQTPGVTETATAAPSRPAEAESAPPASVTSPAVKAGKGASKRPAKAPAISAKPVAGVDATTTTQSGADTRKRGWFWHWNSIVTQFAPLIGLKGVGLLNSYTVWTDRREDSPNRGYAFPSQQSEADFYGEERSELITINKILVALDLIEIRKEMIVKPDAQGRQWRVPHNFYRVKDHDDGYVLSAPAVLGVIHLADRDRNVYRYLRRIFSTRFSPIGSESVWNDIMPTLRRDPTWQRLAAKVETEERRASDRTRAGHAARQGAAASTVLFFVPTSGDNRLTNGIPNDSSPPSGVDGRRIGATSVAPGNEGASSSDGIDVALTNSGLGLDVAGSNEGSRRKRSSSVAGTNEAGPTIVAPTNTMYDQSLSTTRTTTGTESMNNDETTGKMTGTRLGRRIAARRTGRFGSASDTSAVREQAPNTEPMARTVSASDEGRPNPDGAGPDAGAAAIRAFEDANDKPSTTAQRQLLTTLAERFDAAARESATSSTGWVWVTAAIYEAVESGSAYVAPRRIREILARWEREGRPSGNDDDPGRGGRRSPRDSGRTAVNRDDAPTRRSRVATGATPAFVPGTSPVRRPAVLSGQPAASNSSTVSARTAPRRAGPHRGSISGTVTSSAPDSTIPAVPPVARRSALTSSTFTVAECGLASTQVWSAMLTELALGGEIARADLDGCIRGAELIGRNQDGALVIGASSAVTQRRASRYLPALRRAAETIVGVPLLVEVAVRGPWLAQHPDRGVAMPTDDDRRLQGG